MHTNYVHGRARSKNCVGVFALPKLAMLTRRRFFECALNTQPTCAVCIIIGKSQDQVPHAPLAGGTPAIALYDFAGENEGEIPMAAGEHITVASDDGAWAQATTQYGTGFVPTSYIEF